MLAVLAGTEQAALAVDQWTGEESAEFGSPEQRWGSAAGRGNSAPTDATEATASGGRAGALAGQGELPAADEYGITRLPGTAKLPEPGPAVVTEAPALPEVPGFDAKVSKEVTSARKEQQRTYRNPDGTYTTRFYNEPVNYLDAKGAWRPIDTSLKRRDAAGPSTMSVDEDGWETDSTEEVIEFAGTADADPVVRMEVGDGISVAYGVGDAAPVAGQVEGSTVTYADARPGSDVELLAGGDSIKETLILKDASAPTEWRFPLTLEGLTAAIDDHGGVIFADADGKVRAWTPAGWMQDSNLAPDSNEGVISSGVTYSLEEDDGRQVLVVKLDKEWLAAPERVFPVRVDPSVKSVDATSGTYARHLAA
ncbi:hypothetical protein [Streptomyces sp. NPDC004783]|uniref:hypothetical protein n=1 Tax=Streptomyces sp. NPDC004783 TaxID=3154459 RepID=UPI0033B172E4